jgi:O-antigen ligase
MNAVVSSAKPPANKGLLAVMGLTILALLIPAATLSRQLLGEMGSAVMAVVLLSGALVILARASLIQSIPRQTFTILIAALPVMAVYLISAVLHPELSALTTVAQLVLAVVFLLGFSLVNWDKATLKPLFWIFCVLLIFHALWWLAAGMPRMFRGFTGHPNTFGLFSLLLTFVPILMLYLSRRNTVLRIAALLSSLSGLVLVYASTSRAIWLAAAVAVVVFIVWPIIARSRFLFHMSLLMVFAASIATTWLYIVAPKHEWGWQLQELSLRYTGKGFFSGRHRFWDELVVAIEARPWFGYGAGAVAETFTGFYWSAHNLYLQTSLQVGVLGLGALLLMLWVVWGQLWPGRESIYVRLSVAFFLGILTHQIFEISLTQNNLATGFVIWLILAIGLSQARFSYLRQRAKL